MDVDGVLHPVQAGCERPKASEGIKRRHDIPGSSLLRTAWPDPEPHLLCPTEALVADVVKVASSLGLEFCLGDWGLYLFIYGLEISALAAWKR